MLCKVGNTVLEERPGWAFTMERRVTNQIIKRSLAALAMSCAVSLGYQTADASSPPPKWRGSLDFMGFPLADGTIQRSDMFVPLIQGPSTLSYLNLRNELDDDGFAGLSAGVGLRHRLGDWIVGVHGFVDWRESDHSGDYRQFSAGAELLSEHWDLRFNAYLPENEANKDTGGDVVVDIGSGDIYVLAHSERNLRGIDGEVGARLAKIDGSTFSDHGPMAGQSIDLWAHVGGFNYFGEEGFDDIAGVRGRFEIGFDDLDFAGPGSRLSVGVEGRYDETRDLEVAGRVRLRIPFGNFNPAAEQDDRYTQLTPALDAVDQRMTTPVVRWPEEVLNEETRLVADARNPAGEIYESYHEASTRAELEAITAAGGVIFVNMKGGDNDATNWDMKTIRFFTQGTGVSYAAAGMAAPILYDSPFTGNRAKTYFTPAGKTPYLNFETATSINDGAFDFLPNDHINGWDLDATNYKRGIILVDDGRYYITNSTIRNAERSGIQVFGNFVTAPELYIEDSNIIDNGFVANNRRSGGIRVVDGGRVYVKNSNLSHNAGSGVYSDGFDSYIEVTNSTLNYNGNIRENHWTGGLAADSGGEVVANGVTLNYNYGHGAFAFNDTSKITIGGPDTNPAYYENFAIGNGVHGIASAGAATFNAYNMLIAENTQQGVSGSGFGKMNLFNSYVGHNEGYGIGSNDNAVVTANNVIVNGNEQFGLVVWETSASAHVTNSVFLNNERGAVRIHNGGTLTLSNNTFAGNVGSPTFYIAGDATIFGSNNRDMTSGGVNCRLAGKSPTVAGVITFRHSPFVISSSCLRY